MATKTVFITQTGFSTFTVPNDFGSLVSIEAIGSGAGSKQSNKAPGSGGGAYAYSTTSTGLAPGKVLTTFVGAGGSPGTVPSNGQASFVQDPLTGNVYVEADYGRYPLGTTVAGLGGSSANCIGTGPHYSGGNGGVGTTTYAKSGGGGAGGPGGNGGAGGIGTSLSSIGQYGGGGGGAGGISGAGSVGADGSSVTLTGGNGGADGNGNAGGTGANTDTSSVATSPITGGGGGGGGVFNYSPYQTGAAGGNSSIYTSVDGLSAGPGGGGGGGAGFNGLGPGAGGLYGGGAGGGLNGQFGANGIIIFTYNVAASATASSSYTVGQSGVANFVNTTSSAVTNVVANNGLGSYSPVVIGSGGNINKTVALTSNQANVVINVVDINGYKTGITNVTITVNAGVYIYSTNQTSPAIFIYGANPGDTVKLINNGNIVGYGGNGGSITAATQCDPQYTISAKNGYTAISTLSNLSIVNNGYIGGGGGGGGASRTSGGYNSYLGGGGAGGGTGNPFQTRTISFSAPGPNGYFYGVGSCCCFRYYTGGDGGYIITNPVGGSLGTISGYADYPGIGGYAGGSGAAAGTGSIFIPGNDGGGTGNAPTSTTLATSQGGGGGGFGGSGAAGYYYSIVIQVGAAGGYAITKNGKTVTITGSGAIYGTVVS